MTFVNEHIAKGELCMHQKGKWDRRFDFAPHWNFTINTDKFVIYITGGSVVISDKKTGVKGLASPSQDNAMEKLCTLSEDDARRNAVLPCAQGGLSSLLTARKFTCEAKGKRV